MYKTYLTMADIKLMEEAALNLRDQLLIRMFSRTGCRVSELTALTVDDVDLENGTLTIQHLKSRIKASCPLCNARLGKAHIFCPGCGTKVEQVVNKAQQSRKMRTLPVDGETIDMLEHFIKKGGPVLKDVKLMVFGFERGNAYKIVKDCGKRAGLPDLINPATGKKRGISPHRLRDFFAINAIQKDDSGDGLIMLQDHLGHANFNTTAKYRKIASEEHRQWYGKLWEEEEKEEGEDSG
jgi:integrase/recombinase XerD